MNSNAAIVFGLLNAGKVTLKDIHEVTGGDFGYDFDERKHDLLTSIEGLYDRAWARAKRVDRGAALFEEDARELQEIHLFFERMSPALHAATMFQQWLDTRDNGTHAKNRTKFLDESSFSEESRAKLAADIHAFATEHLKFARGDAQGALLEIIKMLAGASR